MGIMLLINKILAVMGGPSMYGMVGQIQNIIMVCNTLGTGAVNNGVVKYSSDGEKKISFEDIVSTSLLLTLISSLCLAVILSAYNDTLALIFLKNEYYSFIFNYLALSVVFSSLNLTVLSIFNGKREIPSYVLCNLSGNLCSLIIVCILSYLYKFEGALIALVTYQMCSFLISASVLVRKKWFSFKILVKGIDQTTIKQLSKYSLMALTTAIVAPAAQILIREHLLITFDSTHVGNWEAMWRLSKAYLTFFTLTLSVYFLPKFSSLSSFSAIRNEVFQGYKLLLPLTVLCCCAIFLFREFIVYILFSDEFILIFELFFFQLMGDFFKVGAFVLSFIMLGKTMVRLYIITEVVFSFSHFFLVVFFVDIYGFEGAAIAYMVNYLLYWLVLYYFLLYRRTEESEIAY